MNILKLYSKKDKRIIVINQNNAGASAARNSGINKSTGKFITFIDSDDDINSGLISELVYHAKNDSDFVMCGMSINGNKIYAADVYLENKKIITQYVLKCILTKNLLYGPYCKLFRLSIISDNKILFPEEIRYGEDTIFVLNYLRHVSNFTNIQQVLYLYNFQSTGLASTNNTNILFRKARLHALQRFIRNNHLSFVGFLFYIMIQLRWLLAFIKNILRTKNV